jgi:hypothetical protein
MSVLKTLDITGNDDCSFEISVDESLDSLDDIFKELKAIEGDSLEIKEIAATMDEARDRLLREQETLGAGLPITCEGWEELKVEGFKPLPPFALDNFKNYIKRVGAGSFVKTMMYSNQTHVTEFGEKFSAYYYPKELLAELEDYSNGACKLYDAGIGICETMGEANEEAYMNFYYAIMDDEKGFPYFASFVASYYLKYGSITWKAKQFCSAFYEDIVESSMPWNQIMLNSGNCSVVGLAVDRELLYGNLLARVYAKLGKPRIQTQDNYFSDFIICECDIQTTNDQYLKSAKLWMSKHAGMLFFSMFSMDWDINLRVIEPSHAMQFFTWIDYYLASLMTPYMGLTRVLDSRCKSPYPKAVLEYLGRNIFNTVVVDFMLESSVKIDLNSLAHLFPTAWIYRVLLASGFHPCWGDKPESSHPGPVVSGFFRMVGLVTKVSFRHAHVMIQKIFLQELSVKVKKYEKFRNADVTEVIIGQLSTKLGRNVHYRRDKKRKLLELNSGGDKGIIEEGAFDRIKRSFKNPDLPVLAKKYPWYPSPYFKENS